MKCRKCEGKTTRRRAGVFSCKRCGVQPGPYKLCRAGLPQSPQNADQKVEDSQ